MDIPIILAVISFQIKWSSHFWLSLELKPNRLSPSLHYLSVASSLLQLSPSPLSRVIRTRPMVFQLICAIATSLVPYKSLYWFLVSFTPDVMPSEIRSPMALITDTNVTTCFQHRFFNITRLQSLIQSIQLINTHLQESPSLFFLIVHHIESFRSLQHKVICRLSLMIVCGRPILFVHVIHWPVRFARLPLEGNFCKESSIFCTASLLLQLSLVQDTLVCVSAVVPFRSRVLSHVTNVNNETRT